MRILMKTGSYYQVYRFDYRYTSRVSSCDSGGGYKNAS